MIAQKISNKHTNHLSQIRSDSARRFNLSSTIFKETRFALKIELSVNHQHGATAVYNPVDVILLALVKNIGGARLVSFIVTVWNDYVLSLAAGWLRIPDKTIFWPDIA